MVGEGCTAGAAGAAGAAAAVVVFYDALKLRGAVAFSLISKPPQSFAGSGWGPEVAGLLGKSGDLLRTDSKKKCKL